MPNNFSEAGCLIPVLLIMVYGLLIICKVPFSLIWIIPIIFCLITTLISIDYSSMGAKHYKPVKKNNDQDQYKRRPRANSNIVNNSVRTHTRPSSAKNSKPIKLAKPQALFCHLCGTRIEIDALFCHQCGSKLE